MRTVPAEQVEDMPAGTRIRWQGREFVRMVDSRTHHTEGHVCEIATGWLGHWSRLFYYDSVEVEV